MTDQNIADFSETDANYVKIEAKTLTGNFATLAFDFDVIGQRMEGCSTPTYILYSTSPRGKQIKVGIVYATNKRAREYRMTVHTGHGYWHARLHRESGKKGFFFATPTDYLNQFS